MLAVILLLVACGSSGPQPATQGLHYQVADQPAPPAQQVLRRRITISPDSLDPALTRNKGGGTVVADLFEGLTTTDAEGRTIPGVASSWDISPDGLTYTFHLRPDARWSNGKPVTASDFVYGWRRVLEPETASPLTDDMNILRNGQAIIDGKLPPSALGVSALDPHTLKVELARPNPDLLLILTGRDFLPIYAPAVKRWGQAWAKPGHMVSNGPFMLTKWALHDHLTVKKNPYYWDAANVRLREVEYFPIPSADGALNRFLAGDVDLVNSRAFPATDVARLRRTLGKQVLLYPIYGISYVGMVVSKPPFDDRKLRRALSMVLDRKVLADKLMQGMGVPATSYFPPLPGYTQHLPDWAHWSMARRLATARQLYKEAGYSKAHPLEVKLFYGTGGVQQRNLAEAMVTMWNQALGSRIMLNTEEFKIMIQDVQHKNASMFTLSLTMSPSPTQLAKTLTKGNGYNLTDYASPAYQAAYDKASQELDQAKRYALMAKVSEIFNHDAPIIPVFFYTSGELVKPYVAGVEPNAGAIHQARYIWIRKYRVIKP